MSRAQPVSMAPQRRLKIPHRLEVSRRPLVSERLCLEPLDTSYHLKFWRAVDDARSALEPWLPWVPYNNNPAASYRYTHACERDWDNHAAVRFAVRLRHRPDLIGVVSLEGCNLQHRSCDLGLLAPPYRARKGADERSRAVRSQFRLSKYARTSHPLRCGPGEYP